MSSHDFVQGYLQEKGWIWESTRRGTVPVKATLYQDGVHIRSEGKTMVLPREIVLEFMGWLRRHKEWTAPESIYSYHVTDDMTVTDIFGCLYCLENLPHTEEDHESQVSEGDVVFYDDGVTPAPIDGQY